MSKFKMLADLRSGEALLPGLCWLPFCVLTGKGERKQALLSVLKWALLPVLRALPSWLDHLPKASHWGLEGNVWIVSGHKLLVSSTTCYLIWLHFYVINVDWALTVYQHWLYNGKTKLCRWPLQWLPLWVSLIADRPVLQSFLLPMIAD